MAIHPLARIVGLVDAYVAWASWRPYRAALSPFRSLERLLKEEVQCGAFDPDVVRAFVETMSIYPIGSFVRLSNGEIAKVLRSNGPAHTQPVVLPIEEEPEPEEDDEGAGFF